MTDRLFVCPFCPLNCDGDGVNQLAANCDLLARRFESTTKYLATAKTDAQSLATAIGWVAEAETFAFTGKVIDLESARKVCEVTERIGAQFMIGEGQNDGFADAFARDGMFSITMGDAASPQQCIVLLRHDPERLPRLHARLSRAKSIYAWKSMDDLVERLAKLRLALIRPGACDVQNDPDLVHTLGICQQTPTLVFAVDIGGMCERDRRPFWSTLHGILQELNRTIRASVLRFDDSITLRSVAAWSSDLPHWKTNIVSTTVDLEIRFVPWPGAIASQPALDEKLNPRRRIVIGCKEQPQTRGQSPQTFLQEPRECETIHLPAAVPAVTTDGIVIRGDGAVTVPLHRVMEHDIPKIASVLELLFSAPGNHQVH